MKIMKLKCIAKDSTEYKRMLRVHSSNHEYVAKIKFYTIVKPWMRRELTQEQLSDKYNVSRTTISKYITLCKGKALENCIDLLMKKKAGRRKKDDNPLSCPRVRHYLLQLFKRKYKALSYVEIRANKNFENFLLVRGLEVSKLTKSTYYNYIKKLSKSWDFSAYKRNEVLDKKLNST